MSKIINDDGYEYYMNAEGGIEDDDERDAALKSNIKAVNRSVLENFLSNDNTHNIDDLLDEVELDSDAFCGFVTFESAVIPPELELCPFFGIDLTGLLLPLAVISFFRYLIILSVKISVSPSKTNIALNCPSYFSCF